MGYTTIFTGRFNLNKELDDNTFKLIKGLAETRRMKRDINKLKEMGFVEDYGVEGEYFIKEDNDFGQSQDDSIINFNCPPITQPGLWLQWIPTEDKMGLEWDKNEKFYNADEWIEYLINRILEPRGYIINGIVNAQGEDRSDKYNITVVNNKVIINKGFSKLVSKPNLKEWYNNY